MILHNKSGKVEFCKEGQFYPRSIYNCKIKNLFMLSVRTSSYGWTREDWRARKIVRVARGDSRVQL